MMYKFVRKTISGIMIALVGGSLLLSCEEDTLQISPSEILILSIGDSIQFSANLDVDWILSNDTAGVIREDGWFYSGLESGRYVLEAVSKSDETNRQQIDILVSRRAADLNPLLEGGHVIYLRHAIARVGGDLFTQGAAGWHRSCDQDTARQLSPEGYVQAQELGEAFRNLAIPLSDTIYVSEYCRCIQTVEEMALDLPFVTRKEVTFYVYGEPERHANTQAFINSFTPSDKNVLIVAHSFGPGSSYQQPAQGYSVIFQKGGSEPEFKTVIRDDEFIQLK